MHRRIYNKTSHTEGGTGRKRRGKIASLWMAMCLSSATCAEPSCRLRPVNMLMQMLVSFVAVPSPLMLFPRVPTLLSVGMYSQEPVDSWCWVILGGGAKFSFRFVSWVGVSVPQTDALSGRGRRSRSGPGSPSGEQRSGRRRRRRQSGTPPRRRGRWPGRSP